MGVFVKICGLTCAEQVEKVVALQPDAVGFIFWPPSARNVQPEDVAAWTRTMPSSILKVGVFVDDEPDALRRTCDQAGLQVVQWHGREGQAPPDVPGLRRWQVVHLDRACPPVNTGPSVDAWLIDQYTAEAPGGTGLTADWDVAASFVREAGNPVVLAGGLNPDNVSTALTRVRPWGVDVSSGVEVSPGRKDMNKVKDFIDVCRNG